MARPRKALATGAERTTAEAAALDERAYLRGCRELEQRIACPAFDPLIAPAGATRFVDDPSVARRLAKAERAEPMDRARLIEELATDLFGVDRVARILTLNRDRSREAS